LKGILQVSAKMPCPTTPARCFPLGNQPTFPNPWVKVQWFEAKTKQPKRPERQTQPVASPPPELFSDFLGNEAGRLVRPLGTATQAYQNAPSGNPSMSTPQIPTHNIQIQPDWCLHSVQHQKVNQDFRIEFRYQIDYSGIRLPSANKGAITTCTPLN